MGITHLLDMTNNKQPTKKPAALCGDTPRPKISLEDIRVVERPTLSAGEEEILVQNDEEVRTYRRASDGTYGPMSNADERELYDEPAFKVISDRRKSVKKASEAQKKAAKAASQGTQDQPGQSSAKKTDQGGRLKQPSDVNPVALKNATNEAN